MQNSFMKRLRWMSALLACLAALATGLPAFASAPEMVSAAAGVSSAPSHCTDCPDCKPVRCAKTVECSAPCAASVSPLLAQTVELTFAGTPDQVPSLRLTVLVGERPPPDPLPPRS